MATSETAQYEVQGIVPGGSTAEVVKFADTEAEARTWALEFVKTADQYSRLLIVDCVTGDFVVDTARDGIVF